VAVRLPLAGATIDVPPPSIGCLVEHRHEVVRLVTEWTGCTIATRRVPEEPGDVLLTAGTITRVRRLLQWKPEVPLHEGIKRPVTHQVGRAPGWACSQGP
jgi:UDP-glucose 4-epimerase